MKILKHGVAGQVSNIAVAREKMIGLASVHPNVVSPDAESLSRETFWGSLTLKQ